MFLTILKIVYLLPISIFYSTIALFSIPFNKEGNAYRWAAVAWSKTILRTFGVHVRVTGMERIDLSKHYVYVSNHASMFDIPAVLASIPNKINLMFKKELSIVPIWGWALRYGFFIMVDRSDPRAAMRSIDRAAETIRSGKSVLLFAEGTRTPDGKLQPFKRGVFFIAVKSGAPVVPVTINNTFRILPKGSLHARPADISLILGKPIPTDRISGKSGEEFLMDEVRKEIEKNYIDQSQG
jgi:1-acyl-sn-glycerol-3-phosphate acyltransferase